MSTVRGIDRYRCVCVCACVCAYVCVCACACAHVWCWRNSVHEDPAGNKMVLKTVKSTFVDHPQQAFYYYYYYYYYY